MTIQHIKAIIACEEAALRLAIHEESLNMIQSIEGNCGAMSPLSEANDIKNANEKILLYIDSIRDKQRTITPSQISKELGMSQDFIEAMLIANGFEGD